MHTSINPARECIDAFSTGKEGLLLIHNYAIEKSPSHHLYAVERGLRILENPDGSGECLCALNKKKPRHKAGVNGYGEYTTITAIAGEPTEVAD